MKTKKVLEIYRNCGAYLEATEIEHFLLNSGKHSASFLQSATVFQHPRQTRDIALWILTEINRIDWDIENKIEVVAVPAVGAIPLGCEVARILGVKIIYAEKGLEGEMYFRKGFEFEPGTRFLVLEDVITSGATLKKVINLVGNKGGEVIICGAVIDRSGTHLDFGHSFARSVKLDLPTFAPQDCPYCKAGSQAVKI